MNELRAQAVSTAFSAAAMLSKLLNEALLQGRLFDLHVHAEDKDGKLTGASTFTLTVRAEAGQYPPAGVM